MLELLFLYSEVLNVLGLFYKSRAGRPPDFNPGDESDAYFSCGITQLGESLDAPEFIPGSSHYIVNGWSILDKDGNKKQLIAIHNENTI